MTVKSSYAKAGPFLPEGQTSFPFRFRVFAPEDVRVYLGTQPLEPLTGYTVNMSADGGEVIFDTPPDKVVTMLREMDFEQDVDLQNNTAFLAEVLEGALDKLMLICQQLKVDADRAVKLPVDATETPDVYAQELFDAVERGEAAAKAALDNAAAAAASAASVKSSETNAAASAASAKASETNVAESAASAKVSETNAGNFATASAASAASAKASAADAAASVDSAAASAAAAKVSETNAGNFATASAASAQAAATDAAATKAIRAEIENYFGEELKELTINLIGNAAAEAAYINTEVSE